MLIIRPVNPGRGREGERWRKGERGERDRGTETAGRTYREEEEETIVILNNMLCKPQVAQGCFHEVVLLCINVYPHPCHPQLLPSSTSVSYQAKSVGDHLRNDRLPAPYVAKRSCDRLARRPEGMHSRVFLGQLATSVKPPFVKTLDGNGTSRNFGVSPKGVLLTSVLCMSRTFCSHSQGTYTSVPSSSITAISITHIYNVSNGRPENSKHS